MPHGWKKIKSLRLYQRWPWQKNKTVILNMFLIRRCARWWKYNRYGTWNRYLLAKIYITLLYIGKINLSNLQEIVYHRLYTIRDTYSYMVPFPPFRFLFLKKSFLYWFFFTEMKPFISVIFHCFNVREKEKTWGEIKTRMKQKHIRFHRRETVIFKHIDHTKLYWSIFPLYSLERLFIKWKSIWLLSFQCNVKNIFHFTRLIQLLKARTEISLVYSSVSI